MDHARDRAPVARGAMKQSLFQISANHHTTSRQRELFEADERIATLAACPQCVGGHFLRWLPKPGGAR
jgi:hypothetical protein